MKLDISEDERLDNWETLINTVDKTDIPLEFVRRINIVFETPVNNVNAQDIDIQHFRNEGFSNASLEEIVNQVFSEYQDNIKNVHFYVDVTHVAEVVQQQTNIFLNKFGE